MSTVLQILTPGDPDAPDSPLIFANALMSTMIFVDALMNAICPPVAVIRALRKILMAASLMLS